MEATQMKKTIFLVVLAFTCSLTACGMDKISPDENSLPLVVDCKDLRNWNADEVYLGGDLVQHNTHAYKANWWTKGQDPDKHSGPWQEWTLLGECENSGANKPPVAKANGPYSNVLGNATPFSSEGSKDPDGTIASYRWDFGDGTTSSISNPTHKYKAIGSYTVTLTVADNEGATAKDTTKVSIYSESGNKIVGGYFAQWGIYARNYHVKNIHTSGSASKLTHIFYAFGNVKNGKCVIGDAYADYDRFYSAEQSVDGVADTWEPGALRGNFGQLRRLKKMYPHLKVLWSFGGWTWSGGFGQAAANPTAFADSCYDLVHDSRWAGVFDGIDIDWEYPNACGLTCDNSGFGAYRTLMSALRSKFGNQMVTSAITADGNPGGKIDAADYAGAAQYVDFYMIMTYDFFGAWASTGPTAPHSPLFNYHGMPISGFSADTAVQKLKSKGIPESKLLLGIGFYGRGWTGVSQSSPGGSATGAASGTYEKGFEDYKVLKNICPATGTIAGTAYAHCGDNWWGYDTPDTIAGKMSYVKSQNLGGAFFWELSGDTTNGELCTAIGNNL